MPRKKQQHVAATDADHQVDTGPGGRTDRSCEPLQRIVAFDLEGERYALPIERVQEVQRIVAFSQVPSGRVAVVGMVNLRGNVIPAVDLRVLVGLPPVGYGLETPMIICRARGELVALLVDAVDDVIDLPAGCLQAAPAMHPLSSKTLGVARLESGLVYVLDLDLILAGNVHEVGVDA